MVKIKICGMTNLDDCQAAVDLGVDFIGFVFYKRSKRYIEPASVRQITEQLHGTAKTVGIFVEERDEEIEGLIDLCGLDFAQVYNSKSATNRISVVRVGETVPEVAGDGLILFDSYSEGFGGSGRPFNIGILKHHEALERAFIAGGIDEENVFEAIALKPYGVDLVSSVEKHRGKKDIAKMKNFVKKVRSFEL